MYGGDSAGCAGSIVVVGRLTPPSKRSVPEVNAEQCHNYGPGRGTSLDGYKRERPPHREPPISVLANGCALASHLRPELNGVLEASQGRFNTFFARATALRVIEFQLRSDK